MPAFSVSSSWLFAVVAVTLFWVVQMVETRFEQSATPVPVFLYGLVSGSAFLGRLGVPVLVAIGFGWIPGALHFVLEITYLIVRHPPDDTAVIHDIYGNSHYPPTA